MSVSHVTKVADIEPAAPTGPAPVAPIGAGWTCQCGKSGQYMIGGTYGSGRMETRLDTIAAARAWARMGATWHRVSAP